MAPADMFWGDRVAAVTDPHGYLWSFATRKKELSTEEMRRATEEFAAIDARRHALILRNEAGGSRDPRR